VSAPRSETESGQQRLARRLGPTDAIIIGLGSMIGAGVFAAFGPAARAAGTGLLIGLVIAAVIAYCNATASAQLAAVYPTSGGTYIYGRERLGDWWGVHGRVGLRGRQDRVVRGNGPHVRRLRRARPVVGAADRRGSRGAGAGRTQLPRCDHDRPVDPHSGRHEGEEVRDPQRTIPRAIPIALLITVAVYLVVGAAALLVAGPHQLANATAPLTTAVQAAGAGALAPVVRIGGALAALGGCWR